MRDKTSDNKQDAKSPELLQKTLRELLEQISKRDQKILRIDAEKTAVLRTVIEKEQIISERDAHILFLEGERDKLLRSKAWKFASALIQTRTRFFPPESRRAQILDKALNIVSFSSRNTGRK
jgi:hypothetical protein